MREKPFSAYGIKRTSQVRGRNFHCYKWDAGFTHVWLDAGPVWLAATISFAGDGGQLL